MQLSGHTGCRDLCARKKKQLAVPSTAWEFQCLKHLTGGFPVWLGITHSSDGTVSHYHDPMKKVALFARIAKRYAIDGDSCVYLDGNSTFQYRASDCSAHSSTNGMTIRCACEAGK